MHTRIPLAAAIVGLYLLHQDVWFWRTARPLVLGFLPIGLAYHAAFCVASAVVMWALATCAWPSHLDEDRRR
jgi:predicted exporter